MPRHFSILNGQDEIRFRHRYEGLAGKELMKWSQLGIVARHTGARRGPFRKSWRMAQGHADLFSNAGRRSTIPCPKKQSLT
jgi:hypothetical protein